MKNQKSPPLSIQTNLTAEQLLDKLNRITTEEFYDAIKSPEYKYYGKISGSGFDIRNKKFSPHSSGPYIKGEVGKTDNKVVLTIEVDIEEQMEIIRKMMYPYFIFIGLLIMAIGAAIEETRSINIAVGALIIASPFLYVAIIRRLLKSMQKEEVKQFSAIVVS